MANEDQQHVPVDRGWAWMIALGFFVNSFCMVGLLKSFGILIQELVIYFNVPLYQGGMVMAVMAITFTIFSPMTIGLGERFTHRKVVMAATLIGFAGLALSCFLVNMVFVIIILGVLVGAGNSALFPNGLVMISKYFKTRLALATGLSLSGASIGVLIMPPIIQVLLETYGLKGTLLLLSGIYLQNLICGALYRSPSFYYRRKNQQKNESETVAFTIEFQKKSDEEQEANSFLHEQDKEKNKDHECKSTVHDCFEYGMASTGSRDIGSVESIDHKLSSAINTKESRASIKEWCSDCLKPCAIMKNPVLLLYNFFGFWVFFGFVNFILLMPGDAISRGITIYEKAFLVSFAGIGDLIGRLTAAGLGDRLGLARYKFVAACCVLNGINVLIYTFANKYWWLAIHSTLYGVLGGCFIALNSVVLIDFVGVKNLPGALSTLMVAQGVAISIGQPFLGLLTDLTDSYTISNAIMGTSMTVGGIVLFFYPLVRRLGHINGLACCCGGNAFSVQKENVPIDVSKDDDKSV